MKKDRYITLPSKFSLKFLSLSIGCVMVKYLIMVIKMVLDDDDRTVCPDLSGYLISSITWLSLSNIVSKGVIPQ